MSDAIQAIQALNSGIVAVATSAKNTAVSLREFIRDALDAEKKAGEVIRAVNLMEKNVTASAAKAEDAVEHLQQSIQTTSTRELARGPHGEDFTQKLINEIGATTGR